MLAPDRHLEDVVGVVEGATVQVELGHDVSCWRNFFRGGRFLDDEILTLFWIRIPQREEGYCLKLAKKCRSISWKTQHSSTLVF